MSCADMGWVNVLRVNEGSLEWIATNACFKRLRSAGIATRCHDENLPAVA